MASFLAFIGLGLLFLVGVIVRFGVTRTAGKRELRERLQGPELSQVESKWGVKLPLSMEAFFRSETVARSDFYLAPPGSNQSGWWYIESFLPLTCRDVSAWVAITNVPGIPIALDASKGTYYLPLEALRQHLPSPVLLRLPGRKRQDRKVASSFDEFRNFEPKEVPAER